MIVYTDGAFSSLSETGGWAYAILSEERELVATGSGAERPSTSQRMEVLAAIKVLERVGGTTHIVSDSSYLINCMRQGWWVKWEKNGWKNAKKEPVANQDLWERLIALVGSREGQIEWEHTRGHQLGTGPHAAMNNLVDELAVQARINYTEESACG